MGIVSKNPATEEVCATFEPLTDGALEERLVRASRAFDVWSTEPFAQRRLLFYALASLLRERRDAVALVATEEMGKPITAARAEVEKCALVCDYFADNAEQLLHNEIIETEAVKSFVRFDPLGCVLAIMPWNFPFWQVFRFAAPALMAGNVGLLKHASNTPRCSLLIEQLFTDAGFPDAVFQSLLIESNRIEKLIVYNRIAAVTVTGSERAGSAVAMAAGKAIKKSVMELGGSDPFIVLEDANLDAACSVAVMARLQNAGQSCIAAKRFIVVKERLEEFVEKYMAAFNQLVVGDPKGEKTQVGPLSTSRIRDDIERQVRQSVALGARVVIGGNRMEGPGYFFEPTILRDVRKGMPVYDEEVFGPVAPVIAVEDAQQAIAVANDTPYGLGASLWTEDTALAETLIPQIQSGCVFVNSMVKSDPRLPFGGIKRSGYGRELSSYGIKEFVNIKTVWIA